MQNTLAKAVLISLALGSAGTAQAVSKKVLNQRLQAVEAEQSSVQERIGKLERSTSTEVMLELLQKVEQLQAENAELRGQVEEQRNTVERLRKRQRDLYLDMDRRLNDVQMSGQTTPQFAEGAAEISAASAATSAAVTESASAPQPKPTVDPAKERAEYEKAFNYLREGRHNDSVAAFNAYLKKSPNGRYADNAQYWIGEAHYVTRKFEKALADFQKVLDDYPRSNKVPDASLKLGYTYYELKRYDKAREVLAKVAKQFPTTKAASLAEKRLLSMSKDGL